eukprot:NODE_5155_length_692_cov_26.304425_g4992_i0.p1 GENE.NODE_5155_length_692_cov_26.304425_g4992_i0~~NODE_5155_length_692_cov_26.304425_g4992_i0.p1  ORF type:complete len:220 (-),score=52.34 NODE_5155_length_692_cov_26.304425_g4992_i0:33-647(-)
MVTKALALPTPVHKVVLLGNAGVGKSSLISQFVNHVFSFECKSTIGVDFKHTRVEVEEQPIDLQIWDTAGGERFQSLSGMFYRGADVCVLVYDVTSPESVEHLAAWATEFSLHAGPGRAYAVVGNKCDLDVSVDSEKVQQFCRMLSDSENREIPVFQTSALANTNVTALFEAVAAMATTVNASILDDRFSPTRMDSPRVKGCKC